MYCIVKRVKLLVRWRLREDIISVVLVDCTDINNDRSRYYMTLCNATSIINAPCRSRSPTTKSDRKQTRKPAANSLIQHMIHTKQAHDKAEHIVWFNAVNLMLTLNVQSFTINRTGWRRLTSCVERSLTSLSLNDEQSAMMYRSSLIKNRADR